ncbi:MAG: DUF1194 domain-containing protein [Mesorhizobium sp.]
MISARAVLACLVFAAAEARAEPVDVELVLAVDVSESMDREEFAIQRAGYVAALRAPDFIAAARSGPNGRVAVTYFEWAGTVRTASLVPWQVIGDRDSAYDFAAKLEARPFATFRGTSISGALAFGVSALQANGFEGGRLVIDVSGDGPNNFGPPVTAARDAAVARGITVNGLPILVRPSSIFPDMDRYYSECVIGGPGAFALPIRAVSEFSTAIRRKLILEVSGNPHGVAIVPAAAESPVDCMVGEKARRSLSDRFYPLLDR